MGGTARERERRVQAHSDDVGGEFEWQADGVQAHSCILVGHRLEVAVQPSMDPAST